MNKLRGMHIAIGMTMMSLTGAVAFAQLEGHQMPGMPSSAESPAVSLCVQSSQTVMRALDAANIRIEDTRQTNEPAKLRAAVSDLQLTLGQMRLLLADCIAASQAGTTTSTTAAMDPSGMSMPAAATGPRLSTTGEPALVRIVFRSKPTPPRAGNNEFEVTLADHAGTPVVDANVSLAFDMPAMPAMNMAEMHATVKLRSVGNGVYLGEGSIGMAGEWDVTITVSRRQQEIESKKIKMTAR